LKLQATRLVDDQSNMGKGTPQWTSNSGLKTLLHNYKDNQ